MVNRCIFFIATAFLFVLSACGGGSDHDAPVEASITTSASSISYEFLDTDPLQCGFTDSFLITVTSEQGIPLRDVDLSIFFPFAQPYVTNGVQLFSGDPAKGGTAKDSPLSVTTDENGSYTLYFQFCGGGGLEYKADFQISSGPLSTSVTFEVTKKTAT
jgi:hypothetical protein